MLSESSRPYLIGDACDVRERVVDQERKEGGEKNAHCKSKQVLGPGSDVQRGKGKGEERRGRGKGLILLQNETGSRVQPWRTAQSQIIQKQKTTDIR
jgi:hypothetical protein